ncbi:MAG: hypothetical protein DDG59_06715, partial [Anaerolineae bacterium]
RSALSSGLFWRVSLFSAATLLFQVILTRLFSVAQFYHFIFLIISIAMLGYAVSGVMLAFRPSLRPDTAIRLFERSAVGGTLTILTSYLILNHLPFDSFSIAWDVRQLALFALNYLALSLPFFFSGLALGALLGAFPEQAGKIYALNFVGAGLGCLGGLVLPSWVGGEGVILVCSSSLAVCALPTPAQLLSSDSPQKGKRQAQARWRRIALFLWIIFCVIELGARLQGRTLVSMLDLRLSPYKGLSYALQYPDAVRLWQRWNAFSRLDVVRSSLIRSVPGLSFKYPKPPPPQDGLFIDGDQLSPLFASPGDRGFTAYLPQSVAFELRPKGRALILEARGGMDILVALHQGAQTVVAVEANPLIVEAAKTVYAQPGVIPLIEDQRSFTRRAYQTYDVILLCLTSSFHPVRSGAYSLAEDYRYTVESFQELIQLLQPEGVLVFNRWLQKPPSESLRAFATVVEALEALDLNPRNQVVVLRGYALATFLVKRQPFTSSELALIRQFASSRAFDLIYAPDLRQDETNRYNVLAESLYTPTFQAVLDTHNRQAFYRSYPYDVQPATDDHPFFAHYFKWSQIRQTLAEFGQSWQPFGGAGMLVLIGLFGFVLALGTLLVGLTAWLITRKLILLAENQQRPSIGTGERLASFANKQGTKLDRAAGLYFTAIGFAYLLVEIALIQRFQLYLAQPAYAVAGVLFSLLVSSGLGSLNAARIRLRWGLPLLAGWIATSGWWMKILFSETMAFPLFGRMVLMALAVAPGGFLMGIAFPGGLRFWFLEQAHQHWMPLIWSLNGAASVVASVAAMLLALNFGFSSVLGGGAIFYAIAALMVWGKESLVELPRL